MFLEFHTLFYKWLVMKFNRKTKIVIVEVICLLCILLFAYAAVSKLLDFNTFQNQLGQSPILSAYAHWVVYLVPAVEILVAIALTIPQFRTVGLYAFFGIMMMFTTYIVIVLNFADFVPCSCGGVLEKMDWTQHLIFNVFFKVLAVFAILLSGSWNAKKKILLLLVLTITGICIVALLFAFSEKKMHRNNAFIRRYIPHPIEKLGEYDLKYNSYYIAGINSGKVYLGNVTTPLQVMALDTFLQKADTIRIKLDNMTLPYKAVNVSVGPSDFFVSDGTVPVILHGLKSNWLAKTFSQEVFFTATTRLDSARIGIRIANGSTLKNSIGVLSPRDTIHEKDLPLYELPAQSDGIFESDGQLLWNSQLKKMIYTYFYSNRYFVIPPSLKKIAQQHTIDTVTSPTLEVLHFNTSGQSKLKGNASIINSYAATYGQYLFIKSSRLGRYEPQEMLDDASIIDVYNIPENQYAFSFYLYNSEGKETTAFHIAENSLYVIMEDKLVKYKLDRTYFKSF